MSVNEDARLSWLTGEKRAIADAVRAGTPFFGACLGAQLLAASLGARVYAGPEPEVGLLPVILTDEAGRDPVFGRIPREFVTLQWHGDTFDLPDGAVRLAASSRYPNQAFRWGDRAYGVQFHVEVSAGMADEWSRVPEYEAYADRVLGPGSLPKLLAELSSREPEMTSHARAMFESWIDAVADVATKGEVGRAG